MTIGVMQGFRRAAIHVALAALLLRAFVPMGWMPGAPGDAPLVMCSVLTVHDTTDGKDIPGKQDDGANGQCAFAGSPALGAPDNMIFYMPVLEDYDRYDEDVLPVRDLSHGHIRPAPRAPPPTV